MSEKYLLLKWGTVKAWQNFDKQDQEMLQKYFDSLENKSISCALDMPNKNSKKLLCDLIKSFNGEIWNDWEGKQMSNNEACEYVMNYGIEK